MIHQGRGGRIVITASIGAFEGGGHHGPYGASKGALVTLVRTMGREWAEYGITVNAVCPGLTATAINQGLLEDKALAESLLDKIPMHRMAQPEEIASAMLYLATDAAAFITGTTLIVHIFFRFLLGQYRTNRQESLAKKIRQNPQTHLRGVALGTNQGTHL